MSKKQSEYIGFSLADRDLLIELKTTVAQRFEDLRVAISDIKANTGLSIQNLQQNSVSKLVTDEHGGQLKDHEGRIRSNERWLYMLAGAFVLLQLEIPIILYFFR